MTDLTEDQYKELPEFLSGDYEKVSTDDGEVYRHVGEIKTAKLKGSLDELDKKYKNETKELSERLTRFEQEQQQKIEDAKAEALENAKNKGDREEIERIYEEKMADLEKRVAERTRGEVMKEISEERAAEKAKSIAAQIATEHAVDADSRETLQELLERRVKVDPETGKEVFHGDDGSALSLDKAGFVEQVIKKSARYARLIKSGVVTNSPAGVKGPGNGGAGSGANQAAEEAKKKGDLNAYLKSKLPKL